MSNDMTVWKQRDLEEKVKAFHAILKQFPELEKLKESIADSEKFRLEYPVALMQVVSKQLDIPITGIDVLGGKPYINKTGLISKVQKDSRQVILMKAVPVIYPFEIKPIGKPGDEDYLKFFIGCSTDGTAVFRGIVEFADGSRYEDEGTANARYLTKEYNKMSTMQPYVTELAATRALNRAMRLATGVGLVSVEEINERGFEIIKQNAKENISTEKAERIFMIEELFEKLMLNDAKILAYEKSLTGGSLQTATTEELEKLHSLLSQKSILDAKTKRMKANKKKGKK